MAEKSAPDSRGPDKTGRLGLLRLVLLSGFARASCRTGPLSSSRALNYGAVTMARPP
jgi:hypothetical protein